MAAYVIAEIREITDRPRYDEYRAQVLATIQRFGGRFIVRGGAMTALEGEWPEERLVVIEFPDAETARDWYASEDYRRLAALRQQAASGRLVVVEGA